MEERELRAGDVIGRYRFLGILGRGGMGEVYEALDELLQRRVAVKVIRSGLSNNDMVERFRREARLLARISHPSAVSIFDFGVSDGRVYLVMELLEGISLRELTNRGPMESRTVRAVASAMGAALGAAHEVGVLHRDVKPGNVHLTRSGRAVLQDFGIANLVLADAETTLTETGVAVGTPTFISPEVLMGRRPGPAADLYSVGVCLYVMLTGELPFTGAAAVAVMYKTVHEGLPSLRGRDGVPKDLAELVADLTQRDPGARPTVPELIERLRCPADAEQLIAQVATGSVRERAVQDLRSALSSEQESVTDVQHARPVPAADVPAGSQGVVLSGETRRHILRSMTVETAEARQREAVGLVMRGELEEAVELLASVCDVCTAALGPDHPTTLAARYWQAVCLARLGAAPEALTAFAAVGDGAAGALVRGRERARLE